MKKVLLILILCLSGILIVTYVRLDTIKDDNKKLQAEIKKTNETKNNIETDNQIIEDNIKKVKEEKKDKWEELEIWQNYIEKINKALS